MATLFANDVELEIPIWVTDLASFRRWTQEPDFPQKGKIWWLRGGVWADMSSEQIFSHLYVKGQIFAVLSALVEEDSLGLMLTDGLLLTNEDAGLSGNPDATFISHVALADRSVVLIEGKNGGWTEAQGSPEMVLEVVSKSSEKKDYIVLREDYFAAGILEYWLVDARVSPPRFDILRRNSTGFVATRKHSGWVKSTVFGKAFRLIEKKDRSGMTLYKLEVK